MKQSVSHYVMPDEKEEVTAELVHRLGLDGIENLIYGDEPSSNLFTSLTVGAHLRFWPRWMDFYLGNTKRYKNSSLMKNPLPLITEPVTRTAGLKNTEKYPRGAGGKAGVSCVACGGLYSGRSMDTAVLLHFERRSSGNSSYL